LKTAGDATRGQSLIRLLDSLLRGGTVGYLSDSLAFITSSVIFFLFRLCVVRLWAAYPQVIGLTFT